MQLRLALIALFLTLWCGPTFGHNPEHKGAYTDWFVNQWQESASALCCGDIDSRGGDAHFVDVERVDNEYYVKIEGKPVRYPLLVNPNHPNPTGQNVVWYKKNDDGTYRFFCLRLATGA